MRSRVGLLTLLLACVAAALAWMLWIKPAQEERQRLELLKRQQASEQRLSEIAESIEKRDGRIVKAMILGVPSRRSLNLLEDATELEELSFGWDAKLDDDVVALLRNHTRLRSLSFLGAGISDKSLPAIGRMHQLQNVGLTASRITDEGLAHLKGLLDLRSLGLARTKIRGPGLKHLASLPKVETLSLSRTGIDDDGLAGLSDWPSLMWLDLSETEIHGPGLRHLAPLKKLWFLWMSKTTLSDASGFEELDHVSSLMLQDVAIEPPSETTHFAKMTQLSQLYLEGPMITDAHLVGLSAARQIKELYFLESGITDEGLAHLEGCSQLLILRLGRGKMSEEAIRRLSEKLPQATIYYGDGSKRLGPTQVP